MSAGYRHPPPGHPTTHHNPHYNQQGNNNIALTELFLCRMLHDPVISLITPARTGIIFQFNPRRERGYFNKALSVRCFVLLITPDTEVLGVNCFKIYLLFSLFGNRMGK